jgi:hypothetical protein
MKKPLSPLETGAFLCRIHRLLLVFDKVGSIFKSLTMDELQIGHAGLSANEKLSLIQQEH